MFPVVTASQEKNMTLQQLKYVVKVAETGNLTKAASELFISQPSLTNAVANLEKEMNVTIFSRTNRGISITGEGALFLSYARQVLDQASLLENRFSKNEELRPRFSVSCQHYSFAVNAMVDVIKSFDAYAYDFTLRETQTYEIFTDLAQYISEIGIIFLSDKNRDVLSRFIKQYNLVFEELFTASPHVFICDTHPLAHKKTLTLEDLSDYPYLSFEQGEYNSFYFSEEITSTVDRRKNIRVRDRATLFNLVIGLNGYTVSSGVISSSLNGDRIIARPLDVREKMCIGTLTRKEHKLTVYGEAYMQALKEHIKA